jgi:putative phosphoesterase
MTSTRISDVRSRHARPTVATDPRVRISREGFDHRAPARSDGCRLLIGVVSDVHCGHAWLSRALAQFGERVAAVWCAGDINLESRFSGPTIHLLRERQAQAIIGNHDAVLLGPHGVRAREQVPADDADLRWLGELPADDRARRWLGERPTEIDDVVGGCRVRMIHGSPWEPHDAYVSPMDRRWHHADQLGVDVLILGHTHEPMVERFGTTLVVNPGSTTEPRQLDRQHTIAVIDLDNMTAQIEIID